VKNDKYVKRVVDTELADQLSSFGAVLIEGPRACGKTATAREVAASEVLLDIDETARAAIQIEPSVVLEGETPRLIDEWQIEPAIWNHVRRAVDNRGQPCQFILTGSSQPSDDVTRHTGAGRISRLRMRPMSLWEMGLSSEEVSLRALLSGEGVRAGESRLSIPDLTEQLSRGGWPGYLGRSTESAMKANRAYLDEIRRVDINRVEGVDRDPDKVGRLLRSLARAVATTTSEATLTSDVDPGADSLSRHTVSAYIRALARLHIVEDQPAWGPHLRSRSILRRSAKRHFIDPSLAVAALNASPERLLNDLSFLGLLFESLVVRDLRVYGQAMGARLYHYQDNTGLEADAILQTDDGRWLALEVKLGTGAIESAAENLRKLIERVDAPDNVGLGVIVSSGYGYMRPDGVSVIPIGALGP